MEKGLLAWLEDKTWEGLSVIGAVVREKVMCWYTTTESLGMRGVVADRSVSMGFPGQAEVCDSKWLLEELCLKHLLTLSFYPTSRMK